MKARALHCKEKRSAGHRLDAAAPLQNAPPAPIALCRTPGPSTMHLQFIIGTLRHLTIATAFLLAAPASAQKTELRILTWVDYVDPEVTAEFGRQHNVEFKYFYFNSDSERDKLLTESDGKGFDVVTVNGSVVEHYRKLGWLAPLDPARMPDLKHASPRWRDGYPGTKQYAVPYMMGTLGLAFRRDLVPEGVDSWMDVFEPNKTLCGKIYMGGDSRELINVALKAAGAKSSSLDPADYKRAEALLLKQKPCVAAYIYPTQDKSIMSDGRAAVAMAFSSDMATLAESDSRVEYVVPKEGGGLWVDYIVAMAASSNPELAMAFLNYTHKPQVHARLAMFTGAMPTNPAAEKLLPAKVRANRTIFPDAQTLARSEEDKGSPAQIVKLRNNIFSKVVRRSR